VSLKNKVLMFFVGILIALMFVLTILSALSFRDFSLFTAERHARSVAETIIVSLTESMINGTMDQRDQFLKRLATVPGVGRVRVIRAQSVIDQFGPGLDINRASSAEIEQVLSTGQPVFKVVNQQDQTVFHAVIPYVADDRGSPNCLQCHLAQKGKVLGAVTVDISLTEVQRQGTFAALMLSLAVLAAALLSLILLYRMMKPLSETAHAVQEVTSLAIHGDFSKRIAQRSTDEVGHIALNINQLMEFLNREITTIRTRVAQLMGQQCNTGGNQLVLTTEMVEGLVDASQFKQAIEEDHSKLDIYRRLARVLRVQYDISRFSIYEIAHSKNRINPVIVDDELESTCRYCAPEIAIDADCCRAKRTGHEVNGVGYPELCAMFRPANEGDTHICLPINQSGTAGCVVQIVTDAESSHMIRLMVPFITVYLREAGPVLEAKRLMEHLRENALRDPMTGLHNRRFLEEYVSSLIASSQRRKSPFSVLMLDIDFFKQVNDTHGHEAGDKVIKTIADILLRNVRSSDVVVRYGGEEFLVVLIDSDADASRPVAEKIRAEVEGTKIPLPGGMLQKTISIGIAEYPADSDTFWQVVKFADVALYRAKSEGRNRVIRFTQDMWDADAHY